MVSRQWIFVAAAAIVCFSSGRAEEAHHQAGIATVRGGQILGQPWKIESGVWRGRIFGSSLTSTSLFDGDGERQPLADNGTFTARSLNLYGEWIVSNRWSVSALLPLQQSTLADDLGREQWTSLGDTYGWARYRLKESEGVSQWLAFGVKIPGTYKEVSGLGDKQVDYEAQYGVTKVFSSRAYLSTNAGYRLRSGSLSDEFLWGTQAGLALRPGWMLIPSLSGAKGVGSGLKKDYLSAGLTVSTELNPSWNVFVSYNNILAGKNTIKAGVWSLGLSFR